MWHPLFKSRMWSGKISFYSMKDKLLPIGMLPMFLDFCKKFSYDYKFDFDVDEFSNDIDQKFLDEYYAKLFKDVKIHGEQLTVRDYQNAVILNGMRNKRGVFEVGTGGGKCSFYDAEIEIELDDELYEKLTNFLKK
jgi:hypothetical protein